MMYTKLDNKFPGEFGSGGSGLTGPQGHAPQPLPEDFFKKSADKLAIDLIGCIVETRIDGELRRGVITETAAYMDKGDPKSHEYKVKKGLPTPKWEAGSLYVYSTQGHVMLTVIASPFKDGATVLIRGIEPLEGISEPTNGPGKLSKALGITTDHNGSNVLHAGSDIRILAGGPVGDSDIEALPRDGKGSPNLRFRKL